MASAGSVPGMDPTPVAQAGGHGNRAPALESDTVLSLDRPAAGRRSAPRHAPAMARRGCPDGRAGRPVPVPGRPGPSC